MPPHVYATELKNKPNRVSALWTLQSTLNDKMVVKIDGVYHGVVEGNLGDESYLNL